MKKGKAIFLIILALLIGGGLATCHFKWNTIKGWFEKKDNTEQVEDTTDTKEQTTLTIDTQNLIIK